MLGVTCPNCGAHAVATLASPGQLSCEACDYRGAPPDGVRDAMQGLQRVLRSSDAGRRQLDQRQRRAVGNSLGVGYMVAVSLYVLTLLISVAVLMVALSLQVQRAPQGVPLSSHWIEAVSFAVPLLLLLGLALLARAAHRRVVRRLRQACAAEPPRAEGAAGSCYICGGPVAQPKQDDRGIVRCDFCDADNLVDPELLARLGRRQLVTAQQLQQRILRPFRGAARALTWVSLVLGPAAVPAAIILEAFLPAAIGSRLQEAVAEERPVDTSRRYVLLCRERTLCSFGELQVDGKVRARTRHASGDFNPGPGADGIKGVPASALVGRSVDCEAGALRRAIGKIERVYFDPGPGANCARVVGRHGKVCRQVLPGLVPISSSTGAIPRVDLD